MKIPLLRMIVRLMLIMRISNTVIGWMMRRTNQGVGRVMRRPSNRRGWLMIALLSILAYGLSEWERQSAENNGGQRLRAADRPAPQRTAMQASARGATRNGSTSDLTVIEGIGPKIAAALVTAGINTFDKLARATESELRTALASAGLRFAPSLTTWNQQAEYAARGDWEQLKTYQEVLSAGRD